MSSTRSPASSALARRPTRAAGRPARRSPLSFRFWACAWPWLSRSRAPRSCRSPARRVGVLLVVDRRHVPGPSRRSAYATCSGVVRERSERSSLMPRPPRPSAIRPVRDSSTTPKSRSRSSSASSFSGLPEASSVSVLCVTSTTFTRNTSAISMMRARLSPSERTLTNISSRSTAEPGSCSRILSTFTSLFSCFVTCSSGFSSTLTTIVIRERPGVSVGPTASESMLNPRAANSPAMRVSTPGRSSTSTDSVCRWPFIRSAPPPGSRGARTRARG